MKYTMGRATTSNPGPNDTTTTCLNTATNTTMSPPPPATTTMMGGQQGLRRAMAGQQGLETHLEPQGMYFFFFSFLIVLISPRVPTRRNLAPYEQPTIAGEGKWAQTMPDTSFGP